MQRKMIVPRVALLALTLICGGPGAFAGPSSIWWPGWTVHSSEELSQGMKYSRNSESPTYPLMLLLDGDPRTAWGFSSTSKEWDQSVWKCPYGVAFEPDHPVVVDALRIMNGQNQRRARFLRNNRVVQIRVTMDTGHAKTARTFNLSDRMGWHQVSLPRRAVKELKVEFARIHKGPANDLCISELALLNHGRKIDMHMPRAVMFYDGLEGCGAPLLITRSGKVLDGIASDIGFSDEWSANGRYVCGYASGGEDESKAHLWIADVWRGKIVRRIFGLDEKYLDYKWKKGNKLQVTSEVKGKRVRRNIKLP